VIIVNTMIARSQTPNRLTGYRVTSCSRMVGWDYTGNKHRCNNAAVYMGTHPRMGTMFLCEDCAPWARKFGITLHKIS